MASRRETKQQQTEVERALRAMAQRAALNGGAMAPSVSEVAQQHGVTRYIAHQALRAIAGEGLFTAVPKVGSFVNVSAEHFAFLTGGEAHPYRAEMQSGFDVRIAQLGGAVLSMESRASLRAQGLAVAGVFSLTSETHPELFADGAPFSVGAPHVRVGSRWSVTETHDLVSFDDEGGGYLATRHLLDSGCRSIAFLGVHLPELQSGRKEWSVEREEGWRRALNEGGLPFHGLSFHPETEPDDDAKSARRVGRSLAGPLLARGDVRGVVAANDALALGLMEALRHEQLSRESWPTIVSFDNSEAARRHNITSLHLPWEEVGRQAADLLWGRAHGQLPHEPQHRGVSMRLIPRLTCRAAWPSFTDDAALLAS